MYGLPQIIIFLTSYLKMALKCDYFKLMHTTGLCCHQFRSITFTQVFLIDFEYIGDHNYLHLLDVLEKYYTIETNFTGSIYC